MTDTSLSMSSLNTSIALLAWSCASGGGGKEDHLTRKLPLSMQLGAKLSNVYGAPTSSALMRCLRATIRPGMRARIWFCCGNKEDNARLKSSHQIRRPDGFWLGSVAAYQLRRADVRRDGRQGQNAVVQRFGVVVVLQHGAQQLEQLAVVRLERLGVGLHHLVQEQEADLFGGESCFLTKI